MVVLRAGKNRIKVWQKIKGGRLVVRVRIAGGAGNGRAGAGNTGAGGAGERKTGRRGTGKVYGTSGANGYGILSPVRICRNTAEYTGPPGISLSEWLKRPVSKMEFFFLVAQSLQISHLVSEKKDRPNPMFPGIPQYSGMHLLSDMRCVYIHEVTRRLQFLCLPRPVEDFAWNVMDFLRELSNCAIPAPESDIDYIFRFSCFIDGMSGCDTAMLERYIAGEAPETVRRIGLDSEETTLLGEEPEAAGRLRIDRDETTLLREEERDGHFSE